MISEIQAGLFAANAQMATHGDFQPATQGKALDACNHRFAQQFDGAHHALAGTGKAVRVNGAQCAQFGDVGPGHERLFARTGQHDDTHAPILAGLVECHLQLADGLVIERIELARPVDGDGAHRTPVVDQQVLEFHGRVL